MLHSFKKQCEVFDLKSFEVSSEVPSENSLGRWRLTLSKVAHPGEKKPKHFAFRNEST